MFKYLLHNMQMHMPVSSIRKIKSTSPAVYHHMRRITPKKCIRRHTLKKTNQSLCNFLSSDTGISPQTIGPCTESDALWERIQTASNTTAVLEAAQAQPTLMYKHCLLALRRLFEIHRVGNDPTTKHLIKDPAFQTLCQNTKKHARELQINEVIEVIKTLSLFGVQANSNVMQTMLQLIRHSINTLNLRQIIFLDFILGRFNENNHLVDALKLALPLAFQIHLPLELDNRDLPLLRDMLSYSCRHNLPDRCINNVITALLLRDQEMDAQMAKSVIWHLCETNCTESVYPTRVQLLHICFDILAQKIDQVSFDDVLITAAKIRSRIVEKHPEYYHEQLMDAIGNYVVDHEKNFERALLVARVLSRTAHTHLSLVKHLCNLATKNPDTLSKAGTNMLFAFINFLSNNNYIPDQSQWKDLAKQISANPMLNSNKSLLPWPKFCLELASLGHFEDKLLSKVFSESFIKEFLSRDDNVLDYLQLLTLHETVKTFHSKEYNLPPNVLQKAKDLYPVHSGSAELEPWVARGVGKADCVRKSVELPNGIIADLVLCIVEGQVVQLPTVSTDKVKLKDLKVPENGRIVCLMSFAQGCYSMNSNRLRGSFRLILDVLNKQGYLAVPINLNEFKKAPNHEKTPFLMREIGYKCREIGIKLLPLLAT